MEAEVDAAAVEGLFTGEISPDDFYSFIPDDYPMWLTVQGGEVVAAVTQYLR